MIDSEIGSILGTSLESCSAGKQYSKTGILQRNIGMMPRDNKCPRLRGRRFIIMRIDIELLRLSAMNRFAVPVVDIIRLAYYSIRSALKGERRLAR